MDRRIDAILSRLLTLHPKKIDLSLGRTERLLAALGRSATAGCRRRSMSPAPTARARPSPFCARCSRPPASACMSTRRRIWCASTSASGSAPTAAASSSTTSGSPRRSSAASRRTRGAADHLLRDHDGGGVSCSSPKRRPTGCCSRWASAGASTRPMSSRSPQAPSSPRSPSTIWSSSAIRSKRSPMRRPAFSRAARRRSSASSPSRWRGRWSARRARRRAARSSPVGLPHLARRTGASSIEDERGLARSAAAASRRTPPA